MTEHAAVIFVFFFLAEYASIVLICILISILFLGGYLFSPLISFLISVINFFNLDYLENTYFINVLDRSVSLAYKVFIDMPVEI
jgi:NADH:ubiquinone oxidoreductase subunit H